MFWGGQYMFKLWLCFSGKWLWWRQQRWRVNERWGSVSAAAHPTIRDSSPSAFNLCNEVNGNEEEDNEEKLLFQENKKRRRQHSTIRDSYPSGMIHSFVLWIFNEANGFCDADVRDHPWVRLSVSCSLLVFVIQKMLLGRRTCSWESYGQCPS